MEAQEGAVDIAPRGDVVLICGENNTRLRVSSHVLGLASNVFRAMLEPRFAEGAQLAAHGYVEVTLPEDNAEVLEILCRALHFDQQTLTANLSADCIFDISLLADKYDCYKALTSIAHRWISKSAAQVSWENAEQSSKLLLAAYMLQQSEMLGSIGNSIVMASEDEITSPASFAYEQGQGLFAVLESARNDVLKGIAQAIEEAFASVSGVSPMLHEETAATCTFIRAFAPDRAQKLLMKLAEDELWPTSYFLNGSRGSVQAILRKMKSFEISFSNMEKCDCLTCIKYPMADGKKVTSNFLTEAQEIENFRYGWICLECVLAGASIHDTQCGHESTEPQTD